MTVPGFISGGEMIFVSILALFIIVLPLVALIDILKNKFEGNTKLIWVIVVIFLTTLGAILYFLIGKKQKLNE